MERRFPSPTETGWRGRRRGRRRPKRLLVRAAPQADGAGWLSALYLRPVGTTEAKGQDMVNGAAWLVPDLTGNGTAWSSPTLSEAPGGC